MESKTRHPAVVPAFLFLISCVLLLPTLIYPYGRDQGIFGYAGHAVLGGGVPFRDFWDPKPPALYYVYALAELLFGYSMASIRILDLLWQAATAVLLYRIAGRTCGGAGVPSAAGLLYVLAYASAGWWNTAQPDGLLNLPLAGAFLLTLRASDRPRAPAASLCAGLLAAIGFLFKYPMGAALPVCMAFLAARRGPRRAAADAALMAAGFVLAAGGYAAYLYGAGAWDEFVYAEFVWVRGYAGLGGGRAGWMRLGEIANSHASVAFLGLLALAAAVAAAARRRMNPAAVLSASWGAVAFASVCLQNKFYLYHFGPLLAPLSVGAAVVAAAPFDSRRPPLPRAAAALAVTAAAALSCAAVNPRYSAYCLKTYAESAGALVTGAATGRPLDAYYRNIRFTSDDFSLPADLAVAEHLRLNTSEGDGVYIWGYETLVYYLAQRRCPSRFIHNLPLRCAWIPGRFGEELLASLERERPKYILVLLNDPAWWATGSREDSLRALRRYPRIERLIAERYAPKGRIEDFLFFGLGGPGAEGGGDAR